MYVVFAVVWQIIVKDVRHGRNVQTTSGNVGCDQNIEIATGKLFKNTQAFFLRHVAGQQTNTVTVCSQMAPDVFTTVFGVREDNGAIWPLFFDQRLQQTHFLFIGRVEELFFNAVTRFLLRFHFYIFGVVHLFERQLAYAIRKGSGEQHVQTLIGRRHAAEQPANVFNEAQIVHAVSFIEHHNLDCAEVNVVLFGVIDKTAGGTDQDIHTAFQHFQLLFVAVAAIGQAKLKSGRLRQGFSVCVDLYRQFSRRCHN